MILMATEKNGIFLNIPNVKDTNPDHKQEELFMNRAYKFNEQGEKEYQNFWNVKLPSDTKIGDVDVSYATFTVRHNQVDYNNQFVDSAHSIMFFPADKDKVLKDGTEVKAGEFFPIKLTKEENGQKIEIFATPAELKQAEKDRAARWRENNPKKDKEKGESLKDRAEKVERAVDKQPKSHEKEVSR